MMLPSIDLRNGHAVQLVGGKTLAIDAGDPITIARQFAIAGEIAVVDLDAALGIGDNSHVISRLLDIAPCRVGGGIRSIEQARAWLDQGATKVVLGTAATPEILAALPKERVIAALDAHHGEVCVEGWTRRTGETIETKMRQLMPFVSGFLVTFIELEGQLKGTEMSLAKELAELCEDAKLTIAGGICRPQEIAELDALGIDAQVGMALYSGDMTLAEGIGAAMTSDRPDGLWPTVITDRLGRALGLAYSNAASMEQACRTRQGVYHSRKRGLWTKGEKSGARQSLVRIDLDCDRDSLRYVVDQADPGFCHLNTRNCWGDTDGFSMLEATLRSRQRGGDTDSYTRRLLGNPDLLRSKLLEEARELAEAKGESDLIWEAADLIYFAMVAMARGNIDLAQVGAELKRRNQHEAASR